MCVSCCVMICICSVIQSHWSLFNGTWQKRPRSLGLYIVCIVFRDDCICSVIQSHSPISFLLVSFQRNVAKETKRSRSDIVSIMFRDYCICSDVQTHWSLLNGTWQKRPRSLGLYNVSIVFRDYCICSVIQSHWSLFNGAWQERPRSLGLYIVCIVFRDDCICSVIQSHSPISISLVSFQRNVAKEI